MEFHKIAAGVGRLVGLEPRKLPYSAYDPEQLRRMNDAELEAHRRELAVSLDASGAASRMSKKEVGELQQYYNSVERQLRARKSLPPKA